jgi:ferredoxin/flavodoxin
MPNLKTLIVYYSFSGNTRKIAHAIQQGISQLTQCCDIASLRGSTGIPGIPPSELLKYNLIGFGSPVWSCSPAPNMISFIDQLPSLRDKHTFFFITHGMMPTGAVRRLVELLKAKRATIIGWQNWYASCFPADMFKPYHTDGHPDAIDLQEAAEFGREMAGRSLRISAGETDLIPALPPRAEYEQRYGRKPVYQGASKLKNYKVRPFLLSHEIQINREKCSGCNLCVNHCPTGSLDLTRNPPIDKNTCVACWVCEQVCPLGAVEIDYDTVVKEREATAGKLWKRNRYFQKNVQRVEKDPRFRPLIPPEEVGRAGYWYQISQHPRIVIPPK